MSDLLALTAAQQAELIASGEVSAAEVFEFWRGRAAGEGSTCTVHARLDEVIEDRKLRFAVEVQEDDRTIGVGTHERRVVDRSAFAN